MARVPLEELVPNPRSVFGDQSWKIRKLGLPDAWKNPVGFLSGYVASLIEFSGDFDGKRPGGVVFVCGRMHHDIYAVLDAEIEQHIEPYVLYGVLLTLGSRVSFYKWERHAFGGVTKQSCEKVYSFNDPEDVCDIVGPTIRGMLNEVTDHITLKFLEAGVQVKLHTAEDMLDPLWKAYPPKPK